MTGVQTCALPICGIKSDFSDELWTLQFWGSNNVPAFGLVAQTPYAYDMVLSKVALKLNLWYHLAATWDLAGNTMKIYVNGILQGSTAFKNVKTTSTFAPISPDTFVPVVVGSQFYDGKKVLPGYYGTNGDINGVLIENRVWSAQEIQDFYELNKFKTAAW